MLRFVAPILVLLSVATAAWSEEPERDSLFDMDLAELSEVRVTVEVGSFFADEELDAGSTVARVTPADWEQRGAQTLEQALGNQPSTVLYPTLWSGSAVAVRGYTTSISGSGIALLFDGVPMNSARFGTGLYEATGYQLFALDSIETIRGPGSPIYGSDAFHGVVAVNTFDSDDDLIEPRLEAGSDGRYRAGLRFSRALSDVVRLNAVAAVGGLGDQARPYRYIDPVSGAEEGSERPHEYDAYTGVLKLEIDPGRRFSATFGAYARGQETVGFPGLGRSLDGFDISGRRDLAGSDESFVMGTATLGWELPRDLTLEWRGYVWNSDADQVIDFTEFNGTLFENDTEETHRGTSVTLKRPAGDRRTRWVLDAGHASERLNHSLSRAVLPDGTVISETADAAQGFDRELSHLTFLARTRIGERLQLLYGGRYDDYSDFGEELSPRIGLIVRPDRASSFKLLYGEAFRAPNALQLAGGDGVDPNPDLDPERIDSLELAWLCRGDRWGVDVTLFANRWDEAIVLVPASPGPLPTFIYVNTGENEAEGIELTGRYRGSRWRTDLAVSSVMSENSDTGDEYGAFPGVIVDAGLGWVGSGGLNALWIQNRVHLDTDVQPVSPFVADPAELRDYWRTDVRYTRKLTERLDGWVTVRNLFDRDNLYPAIWEQPGGIADEAFNVSVGVRYAGGG